MSLIVHEVALELIVELRPLIPSIARHDANLWRQLRRCASSIVLNIAEGEYSDPADEAGAVSLRSRSAAEARAALRVATCWRYVSEARAQLWALERVLIPG